METLAGTAQTLFSIISARAQTTYEVGLLGLSGMSSDETKRCASPKIGAGLPPAANQTETSLTHGD